MIMTTTMNKTIGIISRKDFMNMTIAIAKGEYKPQENDPKIWFESLETAMKVIACQKP